MAADRERAGGAAVASADERLRTIRGFVFDMDGTLVLGDRRNKGLVPLPGARELLAWLDDRAVPYAVVTNGTTRTPAAYAEVLRGLGLGVADGRLLTPASGAVAVLTERGARRVVVLGHEAIAGPIRDAGMEVVEPVGQPQADAVMVGWFPDFTLPPLEAACHAIWGGARLYSASQSLFFATAEGRTLGTSRAICGAIEAITGVTPEIVGKPSPHLLRSAAERLALPLEEIAVVGDDPALETPMAHAGGCLAIAVETGVGGPDDLAALPAEERPHFVFRGVDELLDRLRDLWD
ncbi:HAD-IIA family hydrolase [Egicoccus sp. AB-alg2]|uniref:HAD-IIA family hydrolase n=1 Tax=Egicoccus sp. AB-alg2 TaxID=3242693 RepID=UPI00359D2375